MIIFAMQSNTMVDFETLKGVQRLAAFAIVFIFVFVNFAQSVSLEAVQSKSLTSRKACWSLYSL